MGHVLDVRNLSVSFDAEDSNIFAVKNIHFQIAAGKTLALVGESGSGKTATSLAVMGLLENAAVTGEIFFAGQELISLAPEKMRLLRGQHVAMIFQEPMSSLNPVLSVGYQISEVLRLHKGLTKSQALLKSIELLREVGIENPEERVRSYPHEFSGGQRQRVMIAMAVAAEPQLLIADEPTTALDTETQKQILELLLNLKKKYGMSLLYVTHDLNIVQKIADETAVMWQGQIVEQGPTKTIFENPSNSYTKKLLESRFGDKKNIGDGSKTAVPFLEVKNLSKHFPLKSPVLRRTVGWVKAVDDISFSLKKGRTLGLVGPSGCGKTTLGRTLLRLLEPTQGQILFEGKDLGSLDKKSLRSFRQKIQIVFQDPYSSLNPRVRVGEALTEVMAAHDIGADAKERWRMAESLFNRVGLDVRRMTSFPHQFSGGQRQRICIARALAVKPEFIICDEAVSSLDATVRAQILQLLIELKEEFSLTYIFISHDPEAVKFFADDVAVMAGGRIVRQMPVSEFSGL